METSGPAAGPDFGMLGCDREVFARVWSRVSPEGNGLVEPTPPVAAEPEPAVEPEADSPAGRQLQRLTLTCLEEAATYRELLRRSRRARGELTQLAGQKLRQAKRLSAAYFLMTGVRYWPRETVRPELVQSFFSTLRQRFLAEGRMAAELEDLSREAGDPGLEALYRALAGESRELELMIRLIVEKET